MYNTSGIDGSPRALDEGALKALLLAAFNRVSPIRLDHFPDALPVEQIGLDSLGLSQIVLGLEESLQITLDDGVLGQLIVAETTGDFFVVLRDYLALGKSESTQPG